MTQPTLEQLLREFEEALEVFWTWVDGYDRDEMTSDYVASWSDDLIAPSFVEKVAMVAAARRYIIARNFNVFDPAEADMLFKLQNGGAI